MSGFPPLLKESKSLLSWFSKIMSLFSLVFLLQLLDCVHSIQCRSALPSSQQWHTRQVRAYSTYILIVYCCSVIQDVKGLHACHGLYYLYVSMRYMACDNDQVQRPKCAGPIRWHDMIGVLGHLLAWSWECSCGSQDCRLETEGMQWCLSTHRKATVKFNRLSLHVVISISKALPLDHCPCKSSIRLADPGTVHWYLAHKLSINLTKSSNSDWALLQLVNIVMHTSMIALLAPLLGENQAIAQT